MINILLHCFVFTVLFAGSFCFVSIVVLFVAGVIFDKSDSGFCRVLLKVTNFIAYSCAVLILVELLGLAIISQFFNVN